MNRERINLVDFIRESNRIERMYDDPTAGEIEAHETFLQLTEPSITDMITFVQAIQPKTAYHPHYENRLRERPHMNVSVGGFNAPRGGKKIVRHLAHILKMPKMAFRNTAFHQHAAYESLHPFLDGNGRSGRALWLHSMGGVDNTPLGFLTHWYFQSLAGSDNRAGHTRPTIDPELLRLAKNL